MADVADTREQMVPGLIRDLYEIVVELERIFPGRHFTPDGHLVGSLGEVVAALRYGLALLPASAETHDATASDGRLVQIKATQRDRVALSSKAQHLLVLRLLRSGDVEEVYNGPGAEPWAHAGKRQKNGQRPISTRTLADLATAVPTRDRLPCRER